MEPGKIVEQVLQFAKASYACGKPEEVVLAQLAESGKLALIENALSALSMSVTTPALMQYSCDTTPVALRKHVSFPSCCSQAVRYRSDFDSERWHATFTRTQAFKCGF
eukprot:5316528-Amphidinium_carterae.1